VSAKVLLVAAGMRQGIMKRRSMIIENVLKIYRSKPVVVGFLGVFLLALGACTPVAVAVGAGATAVTASQTEKGFSQSVADQGIEAEISYLWLREDPEIFEDVEMEVEEGRVLLSGQVQDLEHRLDAVRLAWQADGVREVINEIRVGDEGTVADFARDAWITSQINSKLLFDREVSAIDYSVETVNQVVFVMGIAQSPEELDRVIGHAKNVAYVRRVISYVRQKDDPARGS
jgi:osmotically-inducible protein OsmY